MQGESIAELTLPERMSGWLPSSSFSLEAAEIIITWHFFIYFKFCIYVEQMLWSEVLLDRTYDQPEFASDALYLLMVNLVTFDE